MADDRKKEREEINDAPVWMWGIAALGFILVSASIVFMLYEAVAGDTSPPDVRVDVESVHQTRNGFLVEFKAVNQGGSTAEGLMVEGEITNGGSRIEVSDTTLDYLPSHSEREGGLFFTSDPRQFELRLRVKGYEKP